MAMRSSTSDPGSKQKVLVVGPCEAGKTLVANVLAEAVETASEIYRPTVGVRIMEFETEVRNAQRVTVELWDASGDSKFSKCWPAIKKDAAGVVLVYNPEKPNSDQELEQMVWRSHGYWIQTTPMWALPRKTTVMMILISTRTTTTLRPEVA